LSIVMSSARALPAITVAASVAAAMEELKAMAEEVRRFMTVSKKSEVCWTGGVAAFAR
jgi:hypothetical protein